MIRVSTTLKSYERPTRWLPIVHAFSQENQMLTPKMSLRRTVVTATYKAQLDALYQGEGHTVRYGKSNGVE